MALTMLLPATLAAQTLTADPHASQPERPTVATHAGTVAPGWLEIEAGTEFDWYANDSRGGSFPVLFKIGLAPRLQLSILTPIIRSTARLGTGIGDFSVGVKWRVLEDAPILGDFAILPAIKFPTGSVNRAVGSGTTDVGLLLISSHKFGKVAMDLNAGYTRRGGKGTRIPRNGTVWTASFGGPARGRLGWVAEIYGYPGTSGPVGASPIVALLAGPTFQLREWLVLDTGFIVPITGPQPHAFYTGGTYNVGRLWK